MHAVKLNIAEVVFRVKVNQGVTLKELNDMQLSLKRYPVVEDVLIYSGEKAFEEAKKKTASNHKEDLDKPRYFAED